MWLVVCALFTLERDVCSVSSYLRDMEDTETIEFMLRLVSRVFSTGWAVHTGNEPGTMKFLRLEVEALWFQLFCKTPTEQKYVEVDDRGPLKGGHARAFGHICYALCLGFVLLPSLSGVNVLRDHVIDYKQVICSSTLLMNVYRVVSTTLEDFKEEYTSCQV